MLRHPTLDLLTSLGLDGMAKAFTELGAQPEVGSLSHPEWLALLRSRHESDPAVRFEAPYRERLSGFLSDNQFVRLLVLITRLTDKVTEAVKRRISGHFAPAGQSSHFRVVTPIR